MSLPPGTRSGPRQTAESGRSFSDCVGVVLTFEDICLAPLIGFWLFRDSGVGAGERSAQGFHRLHGGVRGCRSSSNPGCYVTKFAPHKALKLTTRCKLTFDERAEVHRVDGYFASKDSNILREATPGHPKHFELQGGPP